VKNNQISEKLLASHVIYKKFTSRNLYISRSCKPVHIWMTQ